MKNHFILFALLIFVNYFIKPAQNLVSKYICRGIFFYPCSTILSIYFLYIDFELYEYLDLENLNFLIGRLRWRENIEILDSLSWYQPLNGPDEYSYHYDQENNLSLYLNIYESRFLHLDLKAFVGQLDFDETITEFIDEDRRVKNSEINYFDHPNMGLIIKIDKS